MLVTIVTIVTIVTTVAIVTMLVRFFTVSVSVCHANRGRDRQPCDDARAGQKYSKPLRVDHIFLQFSNS
ncbi:MAG: hypothetical protein VB934_05345 [Polyangiaceae bacterium]